MKLDWLKTDSAWQPFTFRGVSAFADASFKRLLVGQAIVALASAWAVVWFLAQSWFPVVDKALRDLPVSGELRNGELVLEPAAPVLLADNRFLALIFDPQHSGTIRVPAHVQVEFGIRTFRVISLFGMRDWAYPDRSRRIDRMSLEPWWGAWRPPLLWSVFGAVTAGLLLTWWALALVYLLPLWLIAFFSNRKLTVFGSWKLAGAALLPAALMMLVGIVAYGLGWIGLVELLAFQAAHWVCGVAYAVAATRVRPGVGPAEVRDANPFGREEEAKSKKGPDNPFQSRQG